MSAVAALPVSSPRHVGTTDFVVVGSGIAGMTAALRLSRSGRVHLVTKAGLVAGSTPLAQGGIAAAVGPYDASTVHCQDTITCGCGMTDSDAARAITEFGPQALTWLIQTGVAFDRDDAGRLELGQEGGHTLHRIVHAGGDATGARIATALAHAVRHHPWIAVVERAFLLDLLTDRQGRIVGASCFTGDGHVDWLLARAVVLATGGFASTYATSTNPDLLTADGTAAALRAGAELSDLEFVQFHPTVLKTGGQGQLPLISEAVRGEGAFLVDDAGERFMLGVHPRADLAPRDIVARTAALRMVESGSEQIWLDGRHLDDTFWRRRFPTILATCLDHGIDPAHDLIPVRPAAHYCCGGIATDLDGRTTRPGLYACGEVACTGVHGANRLASNSLLEAVSFAHAVAGVATREAPALADDVVVPPACDVVDGSARATLRDAMLEGCGVLRRADGLQATLNLLDDLDTLATPAAATPDDWETTNLHTVARAVTLAARRRTESRGCHYRADFPETDDRSWRRRITVRLGPNGMCVRKSRGTDGRSDDDRATLGAGSTPAGG